MPQSTKRGTFQVCAGDVGLEDNFYLSKSLNGMEDFYRDHLFFNQKFFKVLIASHASD